MKQEIKISLFSSIISLISIVTFAIMRHGFEPYSFIFYFKVSGVAFYVIFLPLFFKNFKKNDREGLRQKLSPLISILAIVKICFLGFLTSLTGLELWLPFCILGILFLLIFLYKLIIQFKKKDFGLVVVSGILIGIWGAAISYTKVGFSPIFDELLMSNFLITWYNWGGTDAFFHTAIAQMLKTHHIPSTGLDGVPFMYYHYGWHWVIAEFSNFLKIPVLECFTIFYPALFIPLFFYGFLILIVDISDFLNNHEKKTSLDPYFWLIIVCFFLQLYQSNYLAGNFKESFLISQTFTISLYVTFICLSLVLHFKKELLQYSSVSVIIMCFLIPILFVFIGFLKISTLFIVVVLYFYLYLRLRLYRHIHLNISSIIQVILFLSVYYFTVESLPFNLRNLTGEGELGRSGFYGSKNFNFFDFIFIFYIWVYIYIWFTIIRYKIYNIKLLKEAFISSKTLPLEVLLVVAIAGIIPTVSMKLYHNNSMYFLSVQLFLGIILFLANLKFFVLFFSKYFSLIPGRYKKGLSMLIGIYIIYTLFLHNSRDFQNIIKYNWQAKKEIIEKQNENEQKNDFKKNLVRYYKHNPSSRHTAKVKSALNEDQLYILINKLKELDNKDLEFKKGSLIYIDFDSIETHWNYYHYDLPFIVPTYSGIALFSGIPNYPVFDDYSYAYYKTSEKNNKIKNINKIDLCNEVKVKGFKRILIYKFDLKKFITINCVD